MWRQRLYGSGWALQACLRHSPLPFGSSPTLSGRLQAAKVGCHICGVRAGNGTHRLVSGNHVTGDSGDRIKLKSQHYSAYNDNAFAFLPMVVSTYQFMCDDLLRFLWFLAEAQARLAASN